MSQKAKLGTKLTLIVVLITSLVLVAVLGYQVWNGRTRDIANAHANARSLAEANASSVRNKLEETLNTARALTSALSAYERMPLEGRRETLSAVIRQVTEDNEFLLGAWACFEPNALDGRDAEFVNTLGSDKSGRFIPSWVRGESGATLSALVGYDVPGEGDYYQLALRSGEDTVLEPYAYETNGESVLMTTFAVPIRSASGKVVGVAGIDVSLDAINHLSLNKGAYKTANIGVLTHGGVYVAHPKPEAVGSLLSAHEAEAVQQPMLNAIRAGSVYTVETFSDVTGQIALKVLSPIKLGNTGTPWALMQSISMSEVLEESNRNIMISAAGVVLGIAAIVLAVAISVKRIVTVPLRLATAKAQQFAEGNFSDPVHEAFIGRGDEIGDLAKAFDALFDQMNDLLQRLKGSADQVGAGARQISDSSTALAQGATEQASSVEELSASMEQIAAQTQVNTENAKQANELAEKAKREAEAGDEQMHRLLAAMEDINRSSNNISGIIKVIDDIAFQTNILALNAAVEAARAGEHGKGFAVVAGEVRSLAAKSAEAAKEITRLIQESIAKVSDGGKLAGETAEALRGIVTEVENATRLMNGIYTASVEQASGIAQVNQGIIQVSQVVQANSATAEESAAASEELNGQADLLIRQAHQFKLRDV